MSWEQAALLRSLFHHSALLFLVGFFFFFSPARLFAARAYIPLRPQTKQNTSPQNPHRTPPSEKTRKHSELKKSWLKNDPYVCKCFPNDLLSESMCCAGGGGMGEDTPAQIAPLIPGFFLSSGAVCCEAWPFCQGSVHSPGGRLSPSRGTATGPAPTRGVPDLNC